MRQVCTCYNGRIYTTSPLIIITEYELDSDDLELEGIHAVTPAGHMDHTMPLLVGLMHSAAAHRDGSIPLRSANEDAVDLEELAVKRTAGGGMLDSVANMANSILGAGTLFLSALLN